MVNYVHNVSVGQNCTKKDNKYTEEDSLWYSTKPLQALLV